MQFFIRAQKVHILDVSDEETVLDVKIRVAEVEDLSHSDLVLSHAGISLEDEAVLVDCGVQDQCTLDVMGTFLGGIVHASLARAGKVRAQTPKVEKQEKKKKKTGRAKKRRSVYAPACVWQEKKSQ